MNDLPASAAALQASSRDDWSVGTSTPASAAAPTFHVMPTGRDVGRLGVDLAVEGEQALGARGDQVRGRLAERLDVAGVGEREHGGVLATARRDDHDVGRVAALQLGAQRQAVVVRRQRLGLDGDAGFLGVLVGQLLERAVRRAAGVAEGEGEAVGGLAGAAGAAAVVATTGGEREGADRRDGDHGAQAAEPPVAVLSHGAAFLTCPATGPGARNAGFRRHVRDRPWHRHRVMATTCFCLRPEEVNGLGSYES